MSALLVSGGAVHDFPATSRAIADAIDGHVVTTDDLLAGLAQLERGGFDLLVLNTMRRTARWAGQPGERERWAVDLPLDARDHVVRHLNAGRGLLAMHTATNSFDDWPEWPAILGARWVFGTSWHPELAPVTVEPQGEHPIVHGLSPFTVVDEVYTDLDVRGDVEPLATAHGQPLLWARSVLGGRVAYDALGHHVPSLEHPSHRRAVRRAAAWARGVPDAEVRALD